jgi:hypothetical protein
VTETANPENELNLLTDIVVNPNNMEDSDILNDWNKMGGDLCKYIFVF